VNLVENHKHNYGLNTCLAAIGLPKSTWYYQKNNKVSYEKKYRNLREPIMRVVREHSGYGYRRILPDLEQNGYRVGEFVLRRSLNRLNLGLLRSVSKPKPSSPRSYLKERSNGLNLVKDIKDPKPFEVFYTDFTEIPYANGRNKAYLMPILDHKTKWVTGWAVGEHKNTSLALEALNMTHENLEEIGLTLEDRFLHHDQDSVYTGYRWLQAVLISEKARISFLRERSQGKHVHGII